METDSTDEGTKIPQLQKPNIQISGKPLKSVTLSNETFLKQI